MYDTGFLCRLFNARVDLVDAVLGGLHLLPDSAQSARAATESGVFRLCVLLGDASVRCLVAANYR